MPFINMENLRKVQDAIMAANSALVGQSDPGKARVALTIAQGICTTTADQMADPAMRAAANDRYGTDEIEIDDEPAISEGDGGTWVAAWVWIPTPEWKEGDDTPDDHVMTNIYRCDDCDTDWTDSWNCGVDDECPVCGKDYTPVSSEDDPDCGCAMCEAREA